MILIHNINLLGQINGNYQTHDYEYHELSNKFLNN